MKNFLLAALLALPVFPAFAQSDDCKAVMRKIENDMKDQGQKNFDLQIVDARKAKKLKVVGSCEGGEKKIVNMRP